MNSYEFAEQAHAKLNQTRMDGSPFINHPKRVAEIVSTLPEIPKEIMDILIDVAHTHDTIEDTDATIEEIKTLFGEQVASIVWELTSPSSQLPIEIQNAMPRKEKKQLMFDKLEIASDEARLLKLCDRLDNLRDCTNSGRYSWVKKYYAESLDLVALLGSIKNKYLEANKHLLSNLNDELIRIQQWLVKQEK